MAETYDFVIVGSGINSLVCAAMLAKAGKRVIVVERNDRLGGCIRSEGAVPRVHPRRALQLVPVVCDVTGV